MSISRLGNFFYKTSTEITKKKHKTQHPDEKEPTSLPENHLKYPPPPEAIINWLFAPLFQIHESYAIPWRTVITGSSKGSEFKYIRPESSHLIPGQKFRREIYSILNNQKMHPEHAVELRCVFIMTLRQWRNWVEFGFFVGKKSHLSCCAWLFLSRFVCFVCESLFSVLILYDDSESISCLNGVTNIFLHESRDEEGDIIFVENYYYFLGSKLWILRNKKSGKWRTGPDCNRVFFFYRPIYK